MIRFDITIRHILEIIFIGCKVTWPRTIFVGLCHRWDLTSIQNFLSVSLFGLHLLLCSSSNVFNLSLQVDDIGVWVFWNFKLFAVYAWSEASKVIASNTLRHIFNRDLFSFFNGYFSFKTAVDRLLKHIHVSVVLETMLCGLICYKHFRVIINLSYRVFLILIELEGVLLTTQGWCRIHHGFFTFTVIFAHCEEVFVVNFGKIRRDAFYFFLAIIMCHLSTYITLYGFHVRWCSESSIHLLVARVAGLWSRVSSSHTSFCRHEL